MAVVAGQTIGDPYLVAVAVEPQIAPQCSCRRPIVDRGPDGVWCVLCGRCVEPR